MNETQNKAMIRRRIIVVSIIVAFVLSFAAIMWGVKELINAGLGAKGGGAAETSHVSTISVTTQSEQQESETAQSQTSAEN